MLQIYALLVFFGSQVSSQQISLFSSCGTSASSYTVSNDIIRIQVEACGARGGAQSGYRGGYGASVGAPFDVQAGSTWNIKVGCAGSSPVGGQPYGGNGGTSYGAGGYINMFVRTYIKNQEM